MKEKFLFFDDGGVLNDNKVRGNQWKQLIADYFTPLYGGDAESWAKANVYAMGFITDFIKDIQESKSLLSYKDYKNHESELWVEKMFNYVGIHLPPKENYSLLVDQVNTWIIPQIRSSYPGIIEVIQNLSVHYKMNTASNEYSKMLHGYLEGMKVRKFFTYLFGPDLVNMMKSNVDYYNKIFSYAQVDPKKAIIIDDQTSALDYAKSTGATVVQACFDSQKPEFEHYISQPSDLSTLLQKLRTK